MNFAANLARFGAIPAIVTHAAFNTVSAFLAGLFTAVQPSTSNSAWRFLHGLLKAVHLPSMSISFDLVVAVCGLVVALVLIVATKGRLAYERVTADSDTTPFS